MSNEEVEQCIKKLEEVSGHQIELAVKYQLFHVPMITEDGSKGFTLDVLFEPPENSTKTKVALAVDFTELMNFIFTISKEYMKIQDKKKQNNNESMMLR
jgi:hypothetical protein